MSWLESYILERWIIPLVFIAAIFGPVILYTVVSEAFKKK